MGGKLILAIDQSTRKTGYVILDADKKLVLYGIFDKSKVGDTTDYGHTMKRNSLKRDIKNLVEQYHNIIQVVCESVQFQKNPATHMKLSKLQAGVEDVCFRLNMPCYTFNVSSWRSYLPVKFGRKREEIKANTKKYILTLYPEIGEEQEEDVYDAVGIGLAYFNMADKFEVIRQAD